MRVSQAVAYENISLEEYEVVNHKGDEVLILQTHTTKNRVRLCRWHPLDYLGQLSGLAPGVWQRLFHI